MLHGDVHIVKGSTGYIKCLKLFNDHDAVWSQTNIWNLTHDDDQGTF